MRGEQLSTEFQNHREKAESALRPVKAMYDSRPRFPSGIDMPCKSCGSINQSKFTAEMAIHFPGLKNLDKPAVWVFSEIAICLVCGTAEFTLPESELRRLENGEAAAAG
jgi:hypothetical protein